MIQKLDPNTKAVRPRQKNAGVLTNNKGQNIVRFNTLERNLIRFRKDFWHRIGLGPTFIAPFF